MTEGVSAPALAWDEESGGIEWHVELDRAVLLPGRLVDGRLTLVSRGGTEARALVVALVATEHWRHRVTERDANGQTRTEVVTSHSELLREPVQLSGPFRLGPGERLERRFQLPVPGLGPASLDARDAGLEWSFDAKLDIDNAFDAHTERPVVVAQPTALLRAGAVHVGEFALYEGVDVATDGITGTIHVEPMPLVSGEDFTARLELALPGSIKVQEIRAEARVVVEATVAEGERETITIWSGQLATAGTYDGSHTFEVRGRLDPRPLPTIELPHGRAQATFHVILARAWAIDTHLARDITIATTREI